MDVVRSQDARNFYSQEAETKTRLASIRGNNLKAVFKIHHKLYLKKKKQTQTEAFGIVLTVPKPEQERLKKHYRMCM